MVSIIKTDNVKTKEDGCYVTGELRGLSTDEKPTKIGDKIVDNGSIFVEIDTQAIYFYDLDSQEWKGE